MSYQPSPSHKTIIDRLEKKGFIDRVGTVKGRIRIRAQVDPSRVHQSSIERLINKVFAGDRRLLFTHLLSDEALSPEDVAYIEALLAKLPKATSQGEQ